MCGDILSRNVSYQKTTRTLQRVVLCFFASTFGWTPFITHSDIDVYLRTAPPARFSCTVQLSVTSCASPGWTRSSFAIVSAGTSETRRETPSFSYSHERTEP